MGGDVAGAGTFCWGECIALEVCGVGVHAAAGDAVCLEMDAGAWGSGDGDFDQYQRALFRRVFCFCDILGADQTAPQESFCGRCSVVVGECFDFISDAGKGRAGLPFASGMGRGEFAAVGIALDFRERIAISTATVRKFSRYVDTLTSIRRIFMANVSDIHRQILDAWNRRDWDSFRGLLHPEYRYIGPDGKELVGPEAGLNLAKMYANAFPDGKLEAKNVFGTGETAVCEFVARGTHRGELKGIKPTGRRVEINVCNVIELRDGKCYREREYMDMLTMMVQIGVVQPPATSPFSPNEDHSRRFWNRHRFNCGVGILVDSRNEAEGMITRFLANSAGLMRGAAPAATGRLQR